MSKKHEENNFPYIILPMLTALMVAYTGEETAMIEVLEPAADEDFSRPFIGTFWNLTALKGADLVLGTTIKAEF